MIRVDRNRVHRPRRPGQSGVAALGIAALVWIAGTGCAPDSAADAADTGPTVQAGSEPAFQDTIPGIDEQRVTAVVRASERVAPSVVAVNVLRTQQVRMRDPFFDDFFGGFFGPSPGQTQLRQVPSLGSGFVLDESGVILTNDHVVRGAERILVTFPDGRDAEAELIGTDEATDVAVLRVDVPDLPLSPLGRSDDLRIGEWVIAFGNPFGNLISNPEPTVTLGVVSALRRHIVPGQDERGFYLSMIQTDAAINPGNSGGPLVNALGEVVGMNASIFSRSGGSEGLGFAIPIERVLRIADDLIEHGRVRRAWLGLEVEPVDADEFGRTRGVRVARVADGSPADRAGLSEGDRLVEMRGVRLTTPLDFEAVLLDLRAGDPVDVTIEGRGTPLTVRTEERPSVVAERVTVLRDLEVVTLSAAIRQEHGVASQAGALVTGVAPRAQNVLGLRAGDVIVGVNNRPITSATELAAAIEALPAGSRVRLVLERNRGLVTRDFVLGR
ncbi:MAG: PDZ domain-containing protein [Gemmatimonadales bacterium]|nr:MAG: PDZ domain-containing protein [Gemmatimonadales bacterium]